MKLADILKGVEVTSLTGSPDTEITSVAYDSRKVSTGSLFAAVRGLKADGAAYIGRAVEAGAVAVLCEDCAVQPGGVTVVRTPDVRRAMALAAANFYGEPSRRLALVGITGTNGKTTTSYLVKSVIESAGHAAGLLGTIGYQVGGETLPAPNTTPESVDLQGYLARMADAGAAYAVIEVSSHSISLDRVTGCEFKVRVFTNFTQDHLDFHGSMEDYYAAKKKLFTTGGGVSVINMDDPKGMDLKASASGSVITYGLGKDADVTARDVELMADGTRFTLVTKYGEAEVAARLVGRHNLYNMLAAAGTCIALGMGPDQIAHGITDLKEVPGRFEKVDAGQKFAILVDYAHTEDALVRAMTAAREFTRGRLITLFGCGGDRDRGKRPLMGRAAAELSDIVVLTSDNPRTEDPHTILDEVEAGVAMQGSKVNGESLFVIADREEAIEYAVRLASAGDTLLLAGKGHEDYQITGEAKRHFDDREVARRAVEKIC